ncbi:hypothetical protein GCM10011320_45850 [Neoroseomonas lacus]|uniref:Integrase DNA-binding domain-containing protein n=1 Tax=Neoroseomonas lacus TaxID=287609 RepID=A0A917KW32_9PROT|nr:hypothetical protein GCM10011320_45850 [Neoroseomonas lacus]
MSPAARLCPMASRSNRPYVVGKSVGIVGWVSLSPAFVGKIPDSGRGCGADMASKQALTALVVRQAGPGTRVDGSGLMLVVQRSGSATWMLRYSIAGRRRDMGLGSARGSARSPLRTRGNGPRRRTG